MKKIFLALVLFATAAFAEPSFDEMQNLIAQKNYAAAEQGLEVIIQNHPNSAKAFYSMAQAQAGLGHQDKAQFALNKAKGLDPTLKFASTDNVEALQVAITPQVKKIEKVESGTSWWAIFFTALTLGLIGWMAYVFFKKDTPEPEVSDVPPQPEPKPNSPHDAYGKPVAETTSPSDRAYMKDHNIDEDRTPRAPRRPQARYANRQTSYVAPPVVPQPQVVNNHYGSNNDGLVTGMVLGSMMNNHHDHTTVIEREVIVERPSYNAPVRNSTWDENNRSSRDSSWDTPSTPSRSSSWDDDSSSSKSSSSSWSSSSSDSSSSSSSWDSGSSSSDSSSSSWDN